MFKLSDFENFLEFPRRSELELIFQITRKMSGRENGENPEERLANQVTNVTLAALRDMHFDSPPGSATSAPVSSPMHTPGKRIKKQGRVIDYNL